MSVEYVRPIEIARCCIVIRRLNRNNTEEEREGSEGERECVCARERERKIEKKVSCVLVCLGLSHWFVAHTDRKNEGSYKKIVRHDLSAKNS